MSKTTVRFEKCAWTDFCDGDVKVELKLTPIGGDIIIEKCPKCGNFSTLGDAFYPLKKYEPKND